MALLHALIVKSNGIAPRSKPRKKRDNRILERTPSSKPAAITAELAGANRFEGLGIVATGYSPVLVLCRQLLAAGISPDRPLDVYRAGVLVLRVRAIGKAARLTVEDDKNGRPTFRLARLQRGAAPLVRSQPNFDPVEGGQQ